MDLPDTSGVATPDSIPEIEKGWYEMTLEGFELKESQAGNAYTRLRLESQTPDITAFDNISHMPDSLWKVKQLKKALHMGDTERSLTPYLHTPLLVYLKNEIYEGNNTIRVTKYRPLDSVMPPKKEAGDDSDLPF